jgi:hypothetical protein
LTINYEREITRYLDDHDALQSNLPLLSEMVNRDAFKLAKDMDQIILREVINASLTFDD